jgi:Peptidase family M28
MTAIRTRRTTRRGWQAATLRVARIAIGVLMSLSALSVGALLYGLPMPGASFSGSARSLTRGEVELRDELRREVGALSSAIGERRLDAGDSLARAERYLHAELAPLTKLDFVKLSREPLKEAPGAANLVLDVEGAARGPLVLVGAHYDTAPGGTPGANDNASGTAALLALARRLAGAPHALPLRFVWFANEEQPYFAGRGMGSREHAEACKARGEALRAMFSLESIGYYSDAPGSQRYPAPLRSLYPDRGDFIGFVGNLSSRGLVRDTVGRFRRHAQIPSEGAALPAALPGVGWSDHSSFWQAGYEAVMVTDTAVFRDPSYHELTDTPDKLDFERMTRVVSGFEQVLRELADEVAAN